MIHVRALTIAAMLAVPSAVQALTVEENDFAWASELAHAGFVPFAVSEASNASFGMIKGAEMYICFSLDSPDLTALRTERLLDHVNQGAPSKRVPNVPFACALAQ